MEKISRLNIQPRKFLLMFYILVVSFIGVFTLFNSLKIEKDTFDFDTDYVNYRIGGNIVSRGDIEKIYDVNTQRAYHDEIVYIGPTIRAFRSLPFVAYTVSITSHLNFVKALKIHMLVNLLAIASILFLYTRDIKEFILVSLLSIGFFPTQPAIFNGQVTLLMTAAFGLSFFLLHPKSTFKEIRLKKSFPFLAGASLSLLLLKPHFAPIFFFLVVTAKNTKDKIGYTAGFLTGCILLISIGIKDLGFYYIFDYIKFLLLTEDGPNGTRFSILSSSQGVFELLVGTDHAFILTMVFSAIVAPIIFLMFYKARKKIPLDIQLLIATMSVLALSLHVFDHDKVLMLIPMTLLWNNGKRKLFYLIHATSYFAVLRLMPISFLIYLTLSIYLLEYGYEEFERSCNYIAKNWLKI